MSILSEHVKKWRRVTKERLIEALGGSCCICGYKKCYKVLEAHHLDPSKKDISLGQALAHPAAWSKIVIELRKCVLVCSNHHKEVHAGVETIPNDAPRFNEEYANKNFRREAWEPCPICGTMKPPYRKTCSRACAVRRANTIIWDDKVMEDMLKEGKSCQDVADHFDVSNMSVRKRLVKVAKLQEKRRCLYCGSEYPFKHGNQKYCSDRCSRFASRKVARPDRVVLAKEMSEMSMVSIGKKYGVSDTAVRKWAKCYEIGETTLSPTI